jgi:hypothetical protein
MIFVLQGLDIHRLGLDISTGDLTQVPLQLCSLDPPPDCGELAYTYILLYYITYVQLLFDIQEWSSVIYGCIPVLRPSSTNFMCQASRPMKAHHPQQKPTLQPNSRKGYRVSFPPTRDPQRNSQHRKISTNMALDNSRLSIVSNSTSSSAKFRVSLLIFIDFPFIYRYVMNIS